MNTQEKIEALAAGEWFTVRKMDRLYAMDSDHKVVYYDTCWPEGSKWRRSHSRGFERDLPNLEPYTQPESEVLDTYEKVGKALDNGEREFFRHNGARLKYDADSGMFCYRKNNGWVVDRSISFADLKNSTIHDPDAVTIPNPKEVVMSIEAGIKIICDRCGATLDGWPTMEPCIVVGPCKACESVIFSKNEYDTKLLKSEHAEMLAALQNIAAMREYVDSVPVAIALDALDKLTYKTNERKQDEQERNPRSD